MDSDTATNTLYNLYNFLCNNDITINDIITCGIQFNLDNILLPINFDPIYEEWDYDQRDCEAMKLIPEKYKDRICIKSTPNGNCFFNSASLIVFGHEDNHIQLRLAVIVELMSNADHYLRQSIFEKDIFYRDEALNTERQDHSFKKAKEYISELTLMCKPNSWCSMIAFFGLASVLHRPVESLFPNTGSEFMNQIYNRIIMPRQEQCYYPECIIMWSSVSAASFQSSGRSSHFVPVFKLKSYNNNLPQFREKLISQDLIQSFSHDNYIKECVDNSLTKGFINNSSIEQPVNNNSLMEELNNNNNTLLEIQNNMVGLFMGIDNKFIPSINKLDNYSIYPKAKDFHFTISHQKALNTLFIYDTENSNYHWRPWQISNYYLIELLNEQPEFPSQISVSIQKTCETNRNLIKYCYCGGCSKKSQTTFRIIVNQIDLIKLKEVVEIDVIYSINKRECKHIDGKMYGQCRGYGRQLLSKSADFKSPRDMRKKILRTVKMKFVTLVIVKVYP